MTGGLSLIVAIGTLVKALAEFRLQNSLKRFEKYQAMNETYSTSITLTSMRDALRAGGEPLEKYDVIEKYKFMAFYEDIAMMCQSGLMRMEVAAYLFGYDARLAASNSTFAANLGNAREDPNWTLFWSFCDRLEECVARIRTNGYWRGRLNHQEIEVACRKIQVLKYTSSLRRLLNQQ